jgi:hypothetical protein
MLWSPLARGLFRSFLPVIAAGLALLMIAGGMR